MARLSQAEVVWQASDDPGAMLGFLRGRAGDRKLRLFAAACCRRAWHLLPDENCRKAVEAAERFADGRLDREGLRAAHGAVRGELRATQPVEERIRACATFAAWQAASQPDDEALARKAAHWAYVALHLADPTVFEQEKEAQAALLRDVFGNPFRPASLGPACLTADVLALARAAYEERALPSGQLDPARLGVLADALEEAGGAAAGVLRHLRSPGPHVRGCFAVDLVLAGGAGEPPERACPGGDEPRRSPRPSEPRGG